MNKPGNGEFNSYVSGVPNRDFGGIYGHVAQTAVVPTILTWLKIPIRKEWQLSSTSLIGAPGPRKVMLQGRNKNSSTIFWKSNSSNNVRIYRDNQFIVSVQASQGQYTDNSSVTSTRYTHYTLVLNGQTGTVARIAPKPPKPKKKQACTGFVMCW